MPYFPRFPPPKSRAKDSLIGVLTTDFGKLLKFVVFARVNNPCWGPIHALHTGSYCMASLAGTGQIQVKVLDVVSPKLKSLMNARSSSQPVGTGTSLTTLPSALLQASASSIPLSALLTNSSPHPRALQHYQIPLLPPGDWLVCNWRNQMVFYQVNNPWKGRG